MITTLAEPCWRLVDDKTERDYDPFDEGVRHYETEAAAREAIGPLSGIAPKRYDAPCVTVTCSGCGEDYEDMDTYGTVHFPDLDTALSVLDEWKVGPGNKARCPDCAARPDDGALPIVPVPGQLALIAPEA